MKKFLFGLMLFASLVCVANESFVGNVVKVSDGDTYQVVNLETKVKSRVRLAGVDAPEKNQSFGRESTNFVNKTLSEFSYIVTVEPIGTDVYGRTIAWVFYGDDKSGNLNLSETLISNGFAWHFKEYDNSKVLQNLEVQARLSRVGLWQEDNPTYPSDFRKEKKRR